MRSRTSYLVVGEVLVLAVLMALSALEKVLFKFGSKSSLLEA
jgi:hypothetical protein